MVVVRIGRGKVVGMVRGILTPTTDVTTTIPTTTTTTGTEVTVIGGQQAISRRVSISKLLVILGKLVRLEINLVAVMLVGPIHQSQLLLLLLILLQLLLM
jgi:hypothetical protein